MILYFKIFPKFAQKTTKSFYGRCKEIDRGNAGIRKGKPFFIV